MAMVIPGFQIRIIALFFAPVVTFSGNLRPVADRALSWWNGSGDPGLPDLEYRFIEGDVSDY
jgi:hypothetical protein